MTVNLFAECDINAAYIDVNNHYRALEILIEHQLGRLTGKTCQSGFCKYPEFLFDGEKLRQADEAGYLKYLSQCDKEHHGMSKIYGTCSFCNKTYTFYVTSEQMEQYEAYLNGNGLIQDIFPDMDKADRELLRGGFLCKNCWNAMFGEPDTESE